MKIEVANDKCYDTKGWMKFEAKTAPSEFPPDEPTLNFFRSFALHAPNKAIDVCLPALLVIENPKHLTAAGLRVYSMDL